MNIELFRSICLSLPCVTEDMPFDETVLAFRLKGKIFACVILDQPDLVVMKCAPERVLELRAAYPSIDSARYWNKKYWNQVRLDGSVPDDLITDLIHHAFSEVNNKLPKRDRIEL